MRHSRRTTAALVLLPALAATVLAGCTGASSSSSASASASAQATSSTVDQAVDCSTVTIDSDAQGLPTVADSAETVASVTWTDGAAEPTTLVSKTLTAGDGATVSEDSLITVDYVGWQWGETDPFDTSANLGTSFTTMLSNVVPGWRCGLAGHKVGDRVLLSLPSSLAYGDDSSTGAPTGTLVFVVDIKDSVTSADLVSATKDAVAEDPKALSDRGITVSGNLGEPATVSVASGATEPTQPEVIVVARGTGETLAADATVMVHYAMSSWDNSETSSTWTASSPQTVSLTSGSGLEALVGLPVGSRVVILMPGVSAETTGTGQALPATAYVMDLEKATANSAG